MLMEIMQPEPGLRSHRPLPTDGPLYFASAVLPDGRYIMNGGEYNNGADAWTKLGAIYDPVANVWTAVTPLPDGLRLAIALRSF